MYDIFNFFWDQGAHMFLWKENRNGSIVIICENVISKKYLSNDGSAKSNI